MDEPSRTEHWARQQQICEAVKRCAGSRAFWRCLVYARIFRFLLSRYASQEPLSHSAALHTNASNLPTEIDAQSAPQVVPAISSIRSTLKEIHQANVQMPLGPLGAEVHEEVWIDLRRYTRRTSLLKALGCLRTAGIECRSHSQRWEHLLRVRMRDRRVALLLLGDMVRQAPPKRRRMTQWETAKLTFGLALVLCVPTLLLSVSRNDPGQAALALANSVIGLVGLTIIAVWSAWRRYAQET